MQVGDVEQDHCQCTRAERDKHTPRTVYIIDSKHPGADAFAQAAAALAASYVALKAMPEHTQLADRCLRHARTLYRHGVGMQCCYWESQPVCAKTYKSETWQQYMFFAAAWLYKATSEQHFKKVHVLLHCVLASSLALSMLACEATHASCCDLLHSGCMLQGHDHMNSGCTFLICISQYHGHGAWSLMVRGRNLQEALQYQEDSQQRQYWSDYSWHSCYFGACVLLWSMEQDPACAPHLRFDPCHSVHLVFSMVSVPCCGLFLNS